MRHLANDVDPTVKDICREAQITPPTVYKMIREGQLETYTIGRARRITRESWDRLRQGK